MANFKVTTTGIPFRESRFTFVGQGITEADVGKAATIVLAGDANLVKLAAANEPILGRIETVEIEMNGSIIVNVLMSGGFRLACAKGEVFKVGDTIQPGTTAGLVAAGTASTDLRFFVSEPASDEGFVGVIKL